MMSFTLLCLKNGSRVLRAVMVNTVPEHPLMGTLSTEMPLLPSSITAKSSMLPLALNETLSSGCAVVAVRNFNPSTDGCSSVILIVCPPALIDAEPLPLHTSVTLENFLECGTPSSEDALNESVTEPSSFATCDITP